MRRIELIVVILFAVLFLLSVALIWSPFSQKIADATRPVLELIKPLCVPLRQTTEASVPVTSFKEARSWYPSALKYAPSLPVPSDIR